MAKTFFSSGQIDSLCYFSWFMFLDLKIAFQVQPKLAHKNWHFCDFRVTKSGIFVEMVQFLMVVILLEQLARFKSMLAQDIT